MTWHNNQQCIVMQYILLKYVLGILVQWLYLSLKLFVQHFDTVDVSELHNHTFQCNCITVKKQNLQIRLQNGKTAEVKSLANADIAKVMEQIEVNICKYIHM